MPGDPSNRRDDFIDVLRESMENEGLSFPDFYPPETLSALERKPIPKVRYESHYRRFDMGDDADVLELQRVKDMTLNGKWLLAREEWYSTKDGSVFIMLAWAVPIMDKDMTLQGDSTVRAVPKVSPNASEVP